MDARRTAEHAETLARRHRRLTTWTAAAVAASAIGGAVGLITGALPLGTTAIQRLPWHSTAAGGLGLLAIVGAPFASAARASWQRSRRADLMAVLAGSLLMAWITVEIAVVREFSPLQPLFFAIGAAFAMAASSRAPTRHGTPRSSKRPPTPLNVGGHRVDTSSHRRVPPYESRGHAERRSSDRLGR